MRSGKKKTKEKVKKCSLNGSKTLQNEKTKVVESVEWIEPCMKLAVKGKSRQREKIKTYLLAIWIVSPIK